MSEYWTGKATFSFKCEKAPDSHEDLGVEEDEGKERQGHCQHKPSPVCVIPGSCQNYHVTGIPIY